jgi:hypothetical protein
MLALLFALASLLGLLSQLRQAGWSLRRADQRAVFWCLIGIGLGLVIGLRPLVPYLLTALAMGALAAAFLYGLLADWRGWWSRR